MRTLIYLIPFSALLFFRCEENIEPTTLEGQWQLIETLADPGDGSGTFDAIESDQRINLFPDLSFTSTKSLCQQYTVGFPPQGEGTYDTTSMVITPTNCSFDDRQIKYNFELDENDGLIIYYPCIEPCASKYRKIGGVSNL